MHPPPSWSMPTPSPGSQINPDLAAPIPTPTVSRRRIVTSVRPKIHPVSNTVDTAHLRTLARKIPLPHYTLIHGPDSTITISIHPNVTDATKDKWPQEGSDARDQHGQVNYYRSHPRGDSKHLSFMQGLGRGLAELMRLPSTSPSGEEIVYVLQDFPKNYLLFTHFSGQSRKDTYIFGSVHTAKFRTIKEILPHIHWLLTNAPTCLVPCRCKYCTKTKQNQVNENIGLDKSLHLQHEKRHGRPGRPLSLQSDSLESDISRSTSPILDVSRPKRKRKHSLDLSTNPESSPTQTIQFTPDIPTYVPTPMSAIVPHSGAYVPPDRSRELSPTVQFRLGELVWFQLPKRLISSQGDPGLDITRWPAIIIGRELRCSPTIVGTNKQGYPIINAKQNTIYSITLLGMASGPDRVILVSDSDLFPWLSFEMESRVISLDRIMSSRSLGHLFTKQALQELEAANWPTEEDILVAGGLTPGEKRNITRLKAVALSDFAFAEDAVAVLAFAIQYATLLTGSFGFAYPFMISNQDLLTPSSLSDTQTVHLSQLISHQHYQSLWFGAERIWTGDVVRLFSNASLVHSIPKPISGRDHIGEPSPDISQINFLLKVKAFYRDNLGRGMMVGSLYEMVLKNQVPQELRVNIRTSISHMICPANEWVFYLHKPTEGAGDIHLPLEFLAGRLYSPMSAHSTIEWARMSIDYKKHKAAKTLTDWEGPKLRMAALEGLVPGQSVSMNCKTYFGDRKQQHQYSFLQALESLIIAVGTSKH